MRLICTVPSSFSNKAQDKSKHRFGDSNWWLIFLSVDDTQTLFTSKLLFGRRPPSDPEKQVNYRSSTSASLMTFFPASLHIPIIIHTDPNSVHWLWWSKLSLFPVSDTKYNQQNKFKKASFKRGREDITVS